MSLDVSSILRGCIFLSYRAGIFGFAMSTVVASAQTSKLAPEGRGLLAPAPEALVELKGAPPPHGFFKADASGVFYRDIFVTTEDPGFVITVRDYSFPPDKQKHEVALPSGAFAHLISGPGETTIAETRNDLSLAPRVFVPANAPLGITNHGDEPIIVRMLIVETK
jgi:quercetin dioxygenase-like cupin family protein